MKFSGFAYLVSIYYRLKFQENLRHMGDILKKKKAVANALVPVTVDMNIKVPVKLKLQLMRHTDILIVTSIYLMYLMI